jgi:thiamine biosynthesis lipoprotein ApbE
LTNLTLTTADVLSAATRVLPQLRKRLEEFDDVDCVLIDAFAEGIRAAAVELSAQLLEAGNDATLTIEIEQAEEVAD